MRSRVMLRAQEQRREHRAPSSPVTIAIGRVSIDSIDGPDGRPRRLGRGARGAVAVGGRAVDPREEAAADTGRARRRSPASAACTSASNVRAMPMPFSCCAQPSYASSAGNGRSREQVVLVGRVHEPTAERVEVALLPALRRCRRPPRASAPRVRTHLGLAGCARSHRAARRRASRARESGRARRASCRRARRRR